jgi:hypothetical protein
LSEQSAEVAEQERMLGELDQSRKNILMQLDKIQKDLLQVHSR